MTDSLPSAVPTPASFEGSTAQTAFDADAKRRLQRLKNDRLFLAVQEALRPPAFRLGGTLSAGQQLDAIRQAVAAGADVNAKATTVAFDKARPLGMVMGALHLPQSIDVLKALLDLGADAQVRDREGNTFTHMLCRHLWSARTSDTFLANLEQWLRMGGAQHLVRKNRDGDTPMSQVLQNGLYSLSQEQARSICARMVDAGASVTDLPTDLLGTLLSRNQRAGFDLAVELGMDVHQRYQPRHFRTENLWGVWAYHYFGHNGRNHNGASRQAWMERLIGLGVDPHSAHDPNLRGGVQPSSDTPHSALMTVLEQSLRFPSLDEHCLQRLKDLGCCVQTASYNPLHGYAAEGRGDHLEVLHRLGFDLAGARNALGETLLHVACSADLRGKTVHEGTLNTIEGMVRVLLDAGCDPNVPTGPGSELGHALSEAVKNHRTFSDRFNRTATVRLLLDAGASLDGDTPSSDLVGRLMYPYVFASGGQDRGKWQALQLDTERLDTLTLLLQRGARVPQRLSPKGMPLLLGLQRLLPVTSPAHPNPSPRSSTYEPLWDLLIAREDADWPVRVAHQGIEWLAQEPFTTGLNAVERIAMIDWMIDRGVSASALGAAFRAASFKPDAALTHSIETHELRAEMLAVVPEGIELTRPPRARL